MGKLIRAFIETVKLASVIGPASKLLNQGPQFYSQHGQQIDSGLAAYPPSHWSHLRGLIINATPFNLTRRDDPWWENGSGAFCRWWQSSGRSTKVIGPGTFADFVTCKGSKSSALGDVKGGVTYDLHIGSEDYKSSVILKWVAPLLGSRWASADLDPPYTTSNPDMDTDGKHLTQSRQPYSVPTSDGHLVDFVVSVSTKIDGDKKQVHWIIQLEDPPHVKLDSVVPSLATPQYSHFEAIRYAESDTFSRITMRQGGMQFLILNATPFNLTRTDSNAKLCKPLPSIVGPKNFEIAVRCPHDPVVGPATYELALDRNHKEVLGLDMDPHNRKVGFIGGILNERSFEMKDGCTDEGREGCLVPSESAGRSVQIYAAHNADGKEIRFKVEVAVEVDDQAQNRARYVVELVDRHAVGPL